MLPRLAPISVGRILPQAAAPAAARPISQGNNRQRSIAYRRNWICRYGALDYGR